MIRYLPIISLLFCNIVYAEIVSLSDLVKIKVPDNKTYVKYNKLDHMLRNMSDAKFTDKEINKTLLSSKISGSSGDEVAIHINSEKFFKYEQNSKDDFGILENEAMIDDAIFLCAKKLKKLKKSKKFNNCINKELRIANEYPYFFNLWINKNEDLKFKELFSLTDDQIANLSSRQIKKISKKYSPKIKFKSKSKSIKYSGSQSIKITGTGDFYIEEMLSVERYGLKTTYVSFNIPYKNRRFVIFAECIDEYCIDIRKKMSAIIDPTFSINPNGIKTYDFQKKQDMIDLINKVKNGYRIFKIAKLLMFLV
jgi:hypothetical protein